MATGIPAIVANWSGLEEIVDDRYTWGIDCDESPVTDRFRQQLGHTDKGQSLGNFAEPSVPHLRQLMREAYEDQEATAAKGRAAAKWIREQWSYSQCSAKWLEAVKFIYQTTL